MSFGDGYYAQNQRQEQRKHQSGTHKSFLLAYGAENEVCVLFRHILQLCLRSLQKALSGEAARADGNLRLMYIISFAPNVIFNAQSHLYSALLMRLKHIVEDIVHREEEKHGHYGQTNGEEIFSEPVMKHYNGRVNQPCAQHAEKIHRARNLNAAKGQDGYNDAATGIS